MVSAQERMRQLEESQMEESQIAEVKLKKWVCRFVGNYFFDLTFYF